MLSRRFAELAAAASAGGTAAYESGHHGRELVAHVSHAARLAGRTATGSTS